MEIDEPMEVDEHLYEVKRRDEFIDELDSMEVDDYKFDNVFLMEIEYTSWSTPQAAQINCLPQPKFPITIVKQSVWYIDWVGS